LHRLIDESLTRETLNKSELEYNIKKRTEDINTIKNKIQQITKKNTEAAAHNSKIKVILEQIDEFREQLEEKLIELQEAEKTLNILELLKMSFSTNGLISYKIESSVKELESVINEYLAEFGHFQIYFKLAGEKLNIEVVDNEGNNTGIESLSSGERARVNIATVLAIRKIMTSLTSTKINLLFLDEIVGVIDEEGKEKLAEILLKEKLNTFMVSHEWEHPLIEKIHVEKEDNISRIEHG
jgi:DNA repair exonuclease SbcCD ATPase subunit